MARKRFSQTKLKDRHTRNTRVARSIHTRPLMKRTNCKTSLNQTNQTGIVDENEVEIISEDDLPMEEQPEDGELSEIRYVIVWNKHISFESILKENCIWTIVSIYKIYFDFK